MSDQPAPIIRKFNPGLLQSDEEIMEQFVVRGHELALVLDELRGNIASPSCQHILVVGPRGRGKTMLLARIAAELRSHGDLAGSLLPVRFMEESQEVFSLTDFWLETMFHLANEVDEHDATLARELRDTRAALAQRWREQITEAQARAAVLDAADRLGRRLVLIVENLQSLFRDAHDELGWQLREVLQTEPQIILLASATSRFRELDHVEEPFFEMFRIVGLEPLDTEECSRLWEVVSGKPAARREVRPIQILTGGNPRLLVMVAEFARHRSLRRLMSELVTLVDEHTEYFRGHLEVLPKTERRVYVAVIDLWRPSSASEVAARARVDIRVASTMLGRLVERGAVDRQGHGRKRLYAATEPLYSMYYKLRRERDEAAVVENLIRFMVACYGVGDLVRFSAPLAMEAAESGALRRGVRRALAARPAIGDCLVDMKWDAIEQVSHVADARAETIATQRLRYDVEAALAEDQFDRVVGLVDDYVASGWLDVPESMADSRVAWTTYHLAFAHVQLGDARAALSVSERALPFADCDNATILAWTAPTLVARASAQLELGDFCGAIATCDDLIRRFGSLQHRPFGAVIAETFVIRGCSKAYLDDDPGAIRDYGEVVDRFDGSELPEIQERIVSALMSKGLACRRLGDPEGEIASYDGVIERFESSDVLDLRQHAAVALSYKCMRQAEIGLADEALAGCERLEGAIPSFEGDGEPTEAPWAEWLTWRTQGARALALAVQKDYRASMDSFRSAYSAFIADDEVTTREAVHLVSSLVAAGSQPENLLPVLASDTGKSANLRPLLVALHKRAGNPVRAPREIEEVAADIRERFREADRRATIREALGRISFKSDSVQVLSLSHDMKDFEFPLTKAPVNFSVLKSDGLLSNRWGVQVNNKGDAYLYCRDTPNAEKVSLHASGRQHISMPVATAPQVDSGTRFGNIWEEPEFDSEAIPTFSLLFPPWSAGIRPDFRMVTKDELVIVGHRQMTVVVAFFIVDSGRRMRGHIPHFVLGKIPLRPGKTLHVIAWKEPENGLMERVRNVFPHISQAVAQRQLDEGEFTIRLQGYRSPNSAYMVTVPVRYTPPSEEA